MSILSARDLAFDYPPAIRAVRDADLDLDVGELLCVLGPNGAGKTTLLKLLAGILEPQAGQVAIDDRPLDDLDRRERARHIAIVPQSLAYVPDVTVRHFVLGGRYGHLGAWRRCMANDYEIVAGAEAATGIADLTDRSLRSLSGGQLQRVLISRALAQEARVLLVDEPTSSLDPEHQLQVFELLVGFARQGSAVLVVTHDLNLSSQFATAIGLIQDGRVVARGTPDEVLRPEVLSPVYGERLRYGSWPGPHGEERPFVVPWSG